MEETRKSLLALVCFGLMIASAPQAWGQAGTATVTGTVQDQSGAVVPNATVTLTNAATSVATKTSSNEAGVYIIPGVAPGAYRLAVDFPGMQGYQATLTVQVAQNVVVDPILRTGQLQTTVVVQDVTPAVTLDNASLGHVLDNQRIQLLPINGRSLNNLLGTVPGNENGTRNFGQRTGSQTITVDGAVTDEAKWAGTEDRPPSLEAVQEFKIENNASSARFNRPSTVVISTKSGTNSLHGSLVETHRNNGFGLARTRTDTAAKPPKLIRNEFAGSLGGPVYLPKIYDGRNRTFFFTASEGYRLRRATTEGYQVPTEAMRNGDFSGLVDAQGRRYTLYDPATTDSRTWSREPFSYGGKLNVIDPKRQSPLAKALFGITPMPTLPNVNPLEGNNWFGPSPNNTNQWTTSARIDHQIGENDRFFATYSNNRSWNYTATNTRSVPTTDGVAGMQYVVTRNQNLALDEVHTFSPTLFNEINISVRRQYWWNATGEPGVFYNNQLGLPNPFNFAGFPRLTDTGLANYAFQSGDTKTNAWTYVVLDDNVTKAYGRHELQFGVHLRYNQLNCLPDQESSQGNHQFTSFATALYDPATGTNAPAAVPLTGHYLANMYLGSMNYLNKLNRNFFYMRSREYALYFQDNLKLTSRLTLNLGLRWDYWPAPTNKDGVATGFNTATRSVVLGTDLGNMIAMGATVPSLVNTLQGLGVKFETYKEAGLPRNLFTTSKGNFGPRIGFAYRAGAGQRPLVARGGYAVSYFQTPLFTWVDRQRNNAPLSAQYRNWPDQASESPDGIRYYSLRSPQSIVAGLNSQDAVSLARAQGITPGSMGVSFFDTQQPDSRVHTWNFSVEKEIMADLAVKAHYVGVHTDHLEQYQQLNSGPNDYIWHTTTGNQLPTGTYSSVARNPYDNVTYGAIERFQKTGWSNYNGITLEAERRYSKGVAFQLFYVLSNAFTAGGNGYSSMGVPTTAQFLPNAVPSDFDALNRFWNYGRDTAIPKHRVSWNWVVDLPFGKGKPLFGNAGRVANKLLGGWQIAGMGSLRSNYFALPTGNYAMTGEPIEFYGYKYPIQNCTSGICTPGYLWTNAGYIPQNLIGRRDASGRPTGYEGIPENYKPAATPLIPWGSTAMPANAPAGTNVSQFWDTNTVWIPLNNGTVVRTTYNPNMHPWRQQYGNGPLTWSQDASLFKNVAFNEQVNMRFTADFFNVFNHPGNPTAVAATGILSTQNSGQAARSVQLSLKLTW